MKQQVTVTTDLSSDEAWDLAQFLKRAGLRDFRDHAKNDAEAYRMMLAAGKVARALAESGYDPR